MGHSFCSDAITTIIEHGGVGKGEPVSELSDKELVEQGSQLW